MGREQTHAHPSLPCSCRVLSLEFPLWVFMAAAAGHCSRHLGALGTGRKGTRDKSLPCLAARGDGSQPPRWSLAMAAEQEGFVPHSRAVGLNSNDLAGAQKAPSLALAPPARSRAIGFWLPVPSSCWEGGRWFVVYHLAHDSQHPRCLVLGAVCPWCVVPGAVHAWSMVLGAIHAWCLLPGTVCPWCTVPEAVHPWF